MRRAADVVYALLLLSLTASSASGQAEVLFVNETGTTLYYLYASPSTSDTWGDDLLGASVVGHGAGVRIRLLAGATSLDVRAIDADGAEYIVWSASGRSGSTITIDSSARAAAAAGSAGVTWLSVVNDTNYALHEARVLPSGETDWISAKQLLPQRRVVHNGESYRLMLDLEDLGTLLIDLQLIDEDGDRYLCRRIDLETETAVIVTLDDLDW